MKNYNQPIMELIPLAYGEIETGLIGVSSERSAEDNIILSYDQIIGGHYARQ